MAHCLSLHEGSLLHMPDIDKTEIRSLARCSLLLSVPSLNGRPVPLLYSCTGAPTCHFLPCCSSCSGARKRRCFTPPPCTVAVLLCEVQPSGALQGLSCVPNGPSDLRRGEARKPEACRFQASARMLAPQILVTSDFGRLYRAEEASTGGLVSSRHRT